MTDAFPRTTLPTPPAPPEPSVSPPLTQTCLCHHLGGHGTHKKTLSAGWGALMKTTGRSLGHGGSQYPSLPGGRVTQVGSWVCDHPHVCLLLFTCSPSAPAPCPPQLSSPFADDPQVSQTPWGIKPPTSTCRHGPVIPNSQSELSHLSQGTRSGPRIHPGPRGAS